MSLTSRRPGAASPLSLGRPVADGCRARTFRSDNLAPVGARASRDVLTAFGAVDAVARNAESVNAGFATTSGASGTSTAEVDLDFGSSPGRGRILARAVAVLRALADLGPSTLQRLHRHVAAELELGTCERTTHRTLASLADQGLVDRLPGGRENSLARYRLTPRGRDLVR